MIAYDSFIHCIICITHLSLCHFPWPRVLSTKGSSSKRGLQGFFSWLSDWRLQADVGREGWPVWQWCLCLVVRNGKRWPTDQQPVEERFVLANWLLESLIFHCFTFLLRWRGSAFYGVGEHNLRLHAQGVHGCRWYRGTMGEKRACFT